MNEDTARDLSSIEEWEYNPTGKYRLYPHLFEIDGKHHVFDPESGRFFRIDALTRDILELYPENTFGKIHGILKEKHKSEDIIRAMKEIRDMLESGYLYPDAADEFEKPEMAPVTPRLVSTTLNVASTCNLKCIYCWNKGGEYGRAQKEKRMDADTARRAVDLMVEHSLEGDDLLVDFYGGEPLLNYGMLESTMRYCKEIEPDVKRQFNYKVTTNGTLLTKGMVDFFNEMGVSLGLSIDGTKKIHNRNRPFPDGSGSWDEIQRRFLPAMEADNIHASSRATLVPPDIDMVKVTKALFRLGFRDTEVEFASESCEAFRPECYPRYTESETRDMMREYLKFAKFYIRYAVHDDDAIDVGISNNVTRVLHECHRFSPCGAGSNFITVSEEGDIYPCIGFVGMKDYLIGTVRDGFDLDRLKTFRHEMRSVAYEAEECQNCWAKYICAGNCPANNVQHNKDIYRPYARGCDWLRFQLETAMYVASEINLRKPSFMRGFEPV